MANSLFVKGNSFSLINEGLVGFETALVLLDENDKEVQATWDIGVSGDTIPLIGITQYGRVTGMYSVEEAELEITITATPLGGTADDAVDGTTTVGQLAEAGIGDFPAMEVG